MNSVRKTTQRLGLRASGPLMFRLRFSIPILMITILSGSAAAQRITGTLRGQVLDPQGAVIVNAQVVVTNDATGVSESLVTSSAGTYNLPAVLPGSYTVTIDAKGFRKFVKKDVPVLADQDNVADARLDVGVASEVVEVVAGGAQVQTTSSSLNSNYNDHDVVELPNASGTQNGSPLNLAILSPNVVAVPGGVQGTGGAVGGTRPRDNNFTVDGVDDNNLGVTGNNSTVIPDAVAEFAVQTNLFSAEYGHSAGGQFNLVTKTGTNALHGSGEWYAQNRNFNSLDNLTKATILANRAANPPVPGSLVAQPAYDNNRFGGTVGGPIVKDKLFFFAAYEYTTIHGAGPPVSLATAPTAAGLSTLNGMAADSAVQAALSQFPVAPFNNAGSLDVNGTPIPVGSLVVIGPNFQREHDAQANIDYNMARHHFGARFTFNQEKFIAPGSIPVPAFNQDEPVNNRKIALTDAWTINNSTVNDLRLQYSYYFLGILDHCTPGVNCLPDVTLNDLYSVNQVGVSDNQHQKQNSYQIRDAVSLVRGKHTFKFGGEYNHFIYPQFFLPRSVGDYAWSSTSNFINDQVPDVRALRNAGSGSFLGTQSLMSGFVQDDLKVTPRLSLNLGLRYEFWTNPAGANLQALNAISNAPGVIAFTKPKTDKNNFGPRVGFAYDPTGSGKTAIRGGFGIAYDVKFQNFASISLPPQLQSELNVGSACTLNPTPSWCATQTGFLAGGALPQTYIPPAGQAGARALTSSYIDDTVMPKILTWSLGVQREMYKNATLEIRYLGTRGLELPIQFRRNFITYFDAGGTALPTYFDASKIVGQNVAANPTDQTFWNFDFNYFLNCGTTNSLLPTAGLHQSSPDIYQSLGFCGNVTADPPDANSIYHAGSISFTQRAGHGFTFNANYTYSHTIDDATNEFHTSALNPRRAEDSNHLAADRASSDLDVPNKFALSLTYALPKIGSGNHFMQAFLNGYQVGSVFYAQSGQPVTLQSGVDSNGNIDAAGDRVVLNPNGIGETGSDVFPICEATAGTTALATLGTAYVGPTAFTAAPFNGCANNSSNFFGFDPAIGYTPVDPKAKYLVAGAGALTTVGRNSFRTPGFSTVNLAVFKNTYFGEKKYLQLRAEVFNVLNHPSYTLTNGNVFSVNGINTALANAGYAQPEAGTAFLDAKAFGGGIRQMTLGLKFIF